MRDYSLCCRLQARTNVNNLGERCAIEISGSAFLVQGFSRPDTLFEENEGLDLWLSSSLPLFLPNPMDSTPIFTICKSCPKTGNWKGESNIAYPVIAQC
ncbi:uncharacterized protein DS421_9g262360 [Arachis hypogaea]|nr:uncharacterized protein DS421_9g262360 [Arachis hypogaea]